MSDLTLTERYTELMERVQHACERSERSPEDLCVVAVSKFHSSADLRELSQLGQLSFGESRVQELEEKALELENFGLNWHFIGRLQKNKVRKVLKLTPWIHAIDSLALAERVARIALEERIEAQVFLQVMIEAEETKAGFDPDELRAEFAQLSSLEGLRIEGLMCLPPPVDTAEQQRPRFRALRELRNELAIAHEMELPGLSMGMSDDFEVAIEEGASHIRPGTVLFGARE